MKLERIEEFNEWWFSGGVPPELVHRYKRKLFDTLLPHLDKRQIVAITGLRRVGKTTLMYQFIDHLLRHGVDKKRILYFSFDEKVERVEEIINAYREQKSIDLRKQKTYIFFDEIQKLDNWANQIKTYYDLYPAIKFVLSGSEGLFLSSKLKETLAGRIYEFLLKPLSFREYTMFHDLDPGALPAVRLKQLFTGFINTGGFPETIGKDTGEIKLYVKSAVVDKILFQDIAALAGIKDVDLLRTLIELLAANPGMYVEYQSLAQQLDRDRRVIKSYMTLLEQSFLVKTMHNYRKGALSSLRKTKRMYLTDTALIAVHRRIIDEPFFAKMVESAVINAAHSRFFWKNTHEVDLIDVENRTPIEVKYASKIIGKDLLGIRECMRKFSFSKGLVVTKDQEGTMKVPEGTIILRPVWKFLLER